VFAPRGDVSIGVNLAHRGELCALGRGNIHPFVHPRGELSLVFTKMNRGAKRRLKTMLPMINF
jgi:hypothetical protein